ncbi:MAG: SprT family zinc-dependent metalloprotease [Paludibacter sp.]|nr:SprT family zinc-dependent metalloprotease [Paludibacter sp.]
MKTNLEDIFGPIEYVTSHKAKCIRVSIKANGLKVSIPLHATPKDAQKFILENIKPIQAKQSRLKENEKNNPTLLNETSKLKTLTFDVNITRAERNNIFFSLKDGLLKVEAPVMVDFEDSNTQKQIWNGINYFLRKEAKRLLPGRLQQLAEKYGFTYSGVKIQPSKSRWGSCSGDKNINLSYFLMLLPAHLIDYVLLHELCHTIEMNHSAKFWHEMDLVTDGQSKALRAELKKYNMPGI